MAHKKNQQCEADSKNCFKFRGFAGFQCATEYSLVAISGGLGIPGWQRKKSPSVTGSGGSGWKLHQGQ